MDRFKPYRCPECGSTNVIIELKDDLYDIPNAECLACGTFEMQKYFFEHEVKYLPRGLMLPGEQYLHHPLTDGVVFWRERDADGSERVCSNLEMFCGDRTGYTWGAAGARLLAINILENVLRAENYRGGLYDSEYGLPAHWYGTCYRVVWQLAPAFEREFLDDAPLEGAEIRYEAICAWLEAQL